jgi:hypothetical protein
MKIATLILSFLCFTSFNLKAQTNNKFDKTAIEKSLIGKWIFVEAVDKDNKKVDYFIQDYKGPDGKEIKIVASGPDVTINKDYSYVKKFTEVNSDKGTWKLISENEIEFEMPISFATSSTSKAGKEHLLNYIGSINEGYLKK